MAAEEKKPKIDLKARLGKGAAAGGGTPAAVPAAPAAPAPAPGSEQLAASKNAATLDQSATRTLSLMPRSVEYGVSRAGLSARVQPGSARRGYALRAALSSSAGVG